jgi:single-strand DNA-binding protein
MILTGISRIGRDAEVRFTTNGDAVAGLSLAFNYGKKDDQGNRPTTWVKATLFGKRAESLAQYLTKGTQVWTVLSEVRIAEYQKKDGSSGVALEANVVQLEFAGSREQSAGSAPPPPPPPPQRQAPQPQRQPATSVVDMDSDVPF